jgi:GT2 family glycosyltransferase
MLERFLPSVVDYSVSDESLSVSVVVADNGSSDDSVAFMREHYPQVQLVLLDKNYGFAEGYNRALAQVEADYYVLLNSDVECTPHWIAPVVAMMERDPQVAIAQPKLMMYDQNDTFEYAGGAGGFIDSYGYPFCRGRIFSTLEQDHGQYDDECNIFWATGAAMFVKASIFHQLGGLDGDFFAHMEEIDFCWRTLNSGYTVRYCPQSVLYHVGGGTLPKSSPFKTRLNFRNNLSMLYKNLPDERMKKVLRRRMLLDGIAALKFLLQGHVGEFNAVREAHREYRSLLPQLKEKRAALKQETVAGVYQRLLLSDYYFRGSKTFSNLKAGFSK